jgi:hypothetical protein
MSIGELGFTKHQHFAYFGLLTPPDSCTRHQPLIIIGQRGQVDIGISQADQIAQ